MQKIKNETELKEFVSSTGEDIAVVKIGAPWCGPCRVLEANIKEVGDIAKFAEVDVDEADEALVDSLNIRNVPVLLYYKNGEEVHRHFGLATKQDLTGEVERLKNE